MEVVVTNGAISRAKVQSNHHQQTNALFFYRPMYFLSHTNSVKALKGNKAMKDYYLKILMMRNTLRQTYAVDSAEDAGTKLAVLLQF